MRYDRGMAVQSKFFPKIIMQTIQDDGELSIVEVGKQLPFSIQRIYTIDHCVPNLVRGHHAHKKTYQAFFCLRGSVDLMLDNGMQKETVHLDTPHIGVHIAPKVWHEMKNITNETLLLVLASELYDEKDYIRDYQDFLLYIKDSHDSNE